MIYDLPLNLNILVWRKSNIGQSGKWTGPFKLLRIDGEIYKVQLPSKPTDFRTIVVKLYLQPKLTEELTKELTEEPAKELTEELAKELAKELAADTPR